ncbi:MAG: hypothetical protein MJ198_02650 [Bacteroidales bacterium]|nr:hypothetical protein [Bacteroidales bacterium]
MRMPRSPIIFISIFILCLCMSLSCFSQDWDDILPLIESENDGENTDDEYSFLEDLYHSKLNLNELTEEDCSTFIFLSDFEKQSLLYYVEHNKPLFSVYELQFVLGLPKEKAFLLSQFCVVKPIEEKLSLSELIKKGKHIFACNTSFVNVSGKEYSSYYNYAGGAQKEVVRYRFQSENSLYWGITLKKDKGENLSLKNGFDSQSFYVQLKKHGLISNIVLGDYKVSIAQGLTLSQGGSFGNSLEQSGVVQNAVLSKYSSTSEYAFSRGFGATINCNRLKVTPFISYRRLDGKIKDDTNFPFTINKTGYHRTIAEIENKKQISYSMIGCHTMYEWNRLRIGISALQHSFSKDSVSAKIRNASVFYNYFHRHLRLYGEYALDGNLNFATIHGMQYALSDEVQLSQSLRNYSSRYESFMSSAQGKQSTAGNELGWTINVRITTGSRTTLYISNDLFSMPTERTLMKYPTKGNTLRVKYWYKTFTGLSAYYQCSYVNQTEKNEDGFELSGKYSHKIYVSYPIRKDLQLKTSLLYVFKSEEGGLMLYSDVVWKPLKTLSFSCRFAQFNAAYENRLYAWEDDVMYMFSNAQYYYSGTYWYFLTKYKIGNHFIAQLKLSQTQYSDDYELPDSYDLYPEHRKLNCNILLQIEL